MNWDTYPLLGKYDVVVAGGGTSGFAAAATAARNGLKTLVVEELSFFGGTSTAGGVGVFLGLERDATMDNIHGIVQEVLTKMLARQGCNPIHKLYLLGLKELDVPATEYNDEILKSVMDEIVVSSGAEFLFHTHFIGVCKEGDKIKYLLVHNINGIQRIEAKVFIDASFHASVAIDAGVPYELGDPNGNIQPGTLMFKTAFVDYPKYEAFPVEERQKLAKEGMKTGQMPVNFLLARQLQNKTVFHNQSRISVNPLDPRAWSQGDVAGRKQVFQISKWWKNHVPGFEQSELISISPAMGLRDSRRIRGSFQFTGTELMKGINYPDAIAKSSYPIDVHHNSGEVRNTLIRPASGIYYIPYRCLTTNEVSNLLVTGRCISADSEAHAAVRVTMTCMRVGEAAGHAAYESIHSGINVNKLDGSKIRARLQLE